MKLQVFRKLPKHVTVGFSGGVDSVVLAHFLKNKGHEVSLAFQDHGTEFSSREREFCENYALKNNLQYTYSPPGKFTSTSKEANWREMRYDFFFRIENVVATAHHLDDALEHYIMTCARGQGHFMEYRNINVVRPFLCTRKVDIVEYAIENKLEWLEDPTNADVDFTPRNKVRHEILPLMLQINPGLYETVRRNIVRKTNEQDQTIYSE